MCNDKLHDFLAAVPKCEHHMHVEGSLTPELLFSLAAKNNITLPTDKDPAFSSIASLYARYEDFASLDDFLQYYYIGFSVLLTADDFEDLGYAYFAKAASQNVRHAEVFFDVQAHTARGVKYETVVDGLSRARRRAEKEFGMSTSLIVCFLRHLPVPDSLAAFEAAKSAGHFNDGTLAGIGMDSSETPFPPPLFMPIYSAAEDSGIRRTAHVSEEGPPSYIPQALDSLHIQRIDHGVRAAEDGEVMERVAREGVMLTVCPLSNVKLKGFARMEDLPIRVFLDKGVKFSINSDDPAYFGGWILECYCAVQEAFGLTIREWEGIVTNAVEGSWCAEDRKGEILGEIEKVVAQYAS
jgi:adenosine deaminase